MMRRFLSRDRTPVQHVTGTPLAVRVVDAPAEEMPPRPQMRNPFADDIPWTCAAEVNGAAFDAAGDPCGGPPLEVAR